MIHTLITLSFAVLAWPFGWNVEAAAMSAAFYFGREHAQAEYRAISALYGGKRANAPWWCGFIPSAWNAKSLLDWAGPAAVCGSATVM